jgi:hypothetical protein
VAYDERIGLSRRRAVRKLVQVPLVGGDRPWCGSGRDQVTLVEVDQV